MKTLTGVFLFLLLAIPNVVFAQEAFEETTFRARVVSVESFGERSIPETRLSESFQRLTVVLIEGARKGEMHEVENTTSLAFKEGSIMYVHRIDTEQGGELWSAGEPDRRDVLAILAVVFVLVTVLVAGFAGVRAIISLVGSLLAVIFGLLPLLSLGAPPALTCVLFAVGLLVFSMLVTHKVNKSTLVALLASAIALVIGAGIAEIAVEAGNLSGFSSDEASALYFATGGALSLSGLLLGGILIGVVGVLNDVSVSQVHTVVEIVGANPKLSRKEVWKKAMRVGREHVGAVVNTLPLAYAGAALPLLLLFAGSTAPILFILSREVFSAEIIRILSGGIALSLSGAIATFCAVWFLVPGKGAHDILTPHH